jgi:hypothetical protein
MTVTMAIEVAIEVTTGTAGSGAEVRNAPICVDAIRFVHIASDD